MNWYVIDKDYITYLLQFDSRVGYVEYGDRLKLHVGVVLAVGEFLYYVPVSSPKEKHRIMSNSLDFYKLQDPVTGYLYAVLNLNNMIPVPNHCLTQIKYDKLGDFRYFKDEKEKTNYIYLLQKRSLSLMLPKTFYSEMRRSYTKSALRIPLPLLPNAVVILKCLKRNANHTTHSYSLIISAHSTRITFSKSVNGSSIWNPIRPPLKKIVSYSGAVSWIVVGKNFFMPIGLQPPCT